MIKRVIQKPEKGLSIATLNVLFPPCDPIRSLIYRHNTRYEYQVSELFPDMNADVICLQEVTETYLNKLKEYPSLYTFDPFVCENNKYHVYHDSPVLKDGHFTI